MNDAAGGVGHIHGMQSIDAFLSQPSRSWKIAEREARWKELVALVDALPADDVVTAIAKIDALLAEGYADAGVSKVYFEDDQRVAPLHWCAPRAMPTLALAREIALDAGAWRDADLVALAESRWTQAITRVALRSGRLEEILPRLLASALCRGVETLDLRASDMGGDDGAKRIARSSAAETIEVIDLAFCGVTEEGVEALLASPQMSRLSYLIVDANCIDQYGRRGEAYWQDLCARLDARRIQMDCV